MSTLRYLGGLTGLKQQPTPLVHSKLGHGGAKPSTNRRNSFPRPVFRSWHKTHWVDGGRGRIGGYPLVICYIAIENGDLQSIFPLKMVIFHSYVSLLEGSEHNPFFMVWKK